MRTSLTMIALALAGALVLAGAANADPNCKCRANGQNYEIGTLMCIEGRLSQCLMNQNNPSWQPIMDGCPQSRASPLLPQSRIASAGMAGGAPLFSSLRN